MSARNEDFLFAQEAQELGYVSADQVEEGFLLQKKMAEDLKIDERLAVILVKRGWMAEEQAKRVLGIVEPEGTRSQIEGYRLVQMIGRGAMGTVYKAIHMGLHRVVAIKILRRDLAADKTQVERLKREAKLLADLDHPNIVRAFDAGESNGFPYLVMEYVEGETLRERIASKGPMSNEEALRITRALADALEKARRMGVVHRDVKPGNVLMSTSGTPKLMDLGLAKGPLDLGLTQHGATVGTPQFISPEQAQDPRKADTRSDIYSLGASLYAMMTKRPPFEGSTLAEIITKVLYEQPVPPRMRNPNVSPEVGHLIERMMLKDPTLRYQTPAHVVADIDMIRGGQSIVPTGFTGNWEAYLLRKRNRKIIRRSAVGIAAAVVLAIFGMTWWNRMQREEAQAEVDMLADRILSMPPVTAGDPLTDLRKRRDQVVKDRDQIEQRESEDGAHSTNRSDIEKRLEEYASNIERIEKIESTRKKNIDPLVAKAEFAQALVVAQRERERARGYPAAFYVADRIYREVLSASEAHWASARDAIEKRTVSDLPEFVTKWTELHTQADPGQYARTPRFNKERERAKDLGVAAARIGAEVKRFDDAFAEDLVAKRIARLELMELRDALRDLGRAALGAVDSHHAGFAKNNADVPLSRLTGKSGFVTLAIGRIRARAARQVEAHWESLKKLVSTLPPDEALNRLTAFEDAADRGDAFPRLARLARELAARIDEAGAQARQKSQEAFDRARDAHLIALRRGDPKNLRAVNQSALEGPLARPQRLEIEALITGAEALDALHEAAVLYLEGKPKLTDIERRSIDGAITVDPRWKSYTVEKDKGRVVARVSRRISSDGKLIVRLQDFTLPQLERWAMRSGSGLSGLYLALVRLAQIERLPHDDPGQDLRKLIQAYGLSLEKFESLEATEARAWAGLVRAVLDDLGTYQRRREDNAVWTIESIEQLFAQSKYYLALERYKALASKTGKLRYTNASDKNNVELEKKAKVSEEALAKEELLRLLPGADVEEIEGGRHRFHFDFNDETQLDNFVRGLGKLVPQEGGAITPVGQTPYRLMLLAGETGLVRDRPLSIYNMMDPHARITLEVDVRPQGRGSFLVAFDMDGVQIAICSADPNYWKWRWRPGAPLLDGEQRLPEFDFFGRGRGIAFHDGRTFGPNFPVGNDWDWPDFGEGRFFDKWKDSEYLDKRRSRLFAFEPGRKYRVKIIRLRGEMQFWVDGELIARKHDADWTHRGDHSDIDRKFTRGGSGLIQILTWTPTAIDNLSIEGTVMKTWRRHQKMRVDARNAAKQNAKKKQGK